MQRTVDAWAREALLRLTAPHGVRRVGIALTEGGGRRLLFTASDRAADGQVDWCHVDAFHDVPLNHAIATGEVVAGTRSELAGRYADFIAHQPEVVARVVAVPITDGQQPLGGFVLYFGGESAPDLPRLTSLGRELGRRLRTAQRARARLRPTLAELPAPSGSRAATMLLPHDPGSVREARRFVRQTLAVWGVGEEATENAVLCLSELVTNALVHTATDCEVRLLLDRDLLTVTVRDGGGTLVGRNSPPEPLRVHGRGLQLVEALTARSGYDLDEVGTTAWFEISAHD